MAVVPAELVADHVPRETLPVARGVRARARVRIRLRVRVRVGFMGRVRVRVARRGLAVARVKEASLA